MNKTVLKQLVRVIGVCFLGVLIFTVVGCQTSQSPNLTYDTKTTFVTVTNYVTAPAPIDDLQTRNGLSLRDAQDKALKLAPGMTQDEVISLLCKPDETSAGTYGTQTDKPWNGITWYYRWGTNLLNRKVLNILFEKSSDAWVVNSWQWSGF